MDHQDVEYDLQDTQLEQLRRFLDLAHEQLERVQRHPPCDEAAQAEAHQPALAQEHLAPLDRRNDQVTKYAFERRVLLERLNKVS